MTKEVNVQKVHNAENKEQKTELLKDLFQNVIEGTVVTVNEQTYFVSEVKDTNLKLSKTGIGASHGVGLMADGSFVYAETEHGYHLENRRLVQSMEFPNIE